MTSEERAKELAVDTIDGLASPFYSEVVTLQDVKEEVLAAQDDSIHTDYEIGLATGLVFSHILIQRTLDVIRD